MTSLRNCAVCNNPVPARPYQAITARTCSPGCAKALAASEHPEEVRATSRRGENYWRDQLAKENSEKPTPTGETS